MAGSGRLGGSGPEWFSGGLSQGLGFLGPAYD